MSPARTACGSGAPAPAGTANGPPRAAGAMPMVEVRAARRWAGLACALAAACGVPERALPIQPPTIRSFQGWLEGETPQVGWSVVGEVDRLQLRGASDLVLTLEAPSGQRALPEGTRGAVRLFASGPGGSVTARAFIEASQASFVRLDAFSVTPTTPRAGDPVRVDWAVAHARRVVLLDDGAEVSSTLAETGRLVLRPERSTTLRLRAEGLGGPVEASARVTVGAPPPTILGFEADPLEVVEGETTTLRWRVEEAEIVRILATRPDGEETALDEVRSPDPRTSLPLALPVGTHRFRLLAEGPGGARTARATASVAPSPAPTITTLTADPPVTGPGGEVVLAWAVEGGEQVGLWIGDSASVEPVSAIGRRPLRLDDRDVPVELVATRSGSRAEAELTVRLDASRPAVNAWSAQPARVARGEAVTLTWAVQGALDIRVEDDLGRRLHASSAPSGAIELRPAGSLLARLVARGPTGTTLRSTAVEVGVRPRIRRFSALDPVVRSRRPLRMAYAVEDADSVLLSMPGRAAAPLGAASATVARRRTDIPASPDATLIATRDGFTATATVSVTRRPPANGTREEEPNDGFATAHVVDGVSELSGRLAIGDRDVLVAETAPGRRLRLAACAPGLAFEVQRLDDEGAPIGPVRTLDPAGCGDLDPLTAPFGPRVGVVARASAVEPPPGPVDYALELSTPVAACGDGVLDFDEDCDDGGIAGGDGCSPRCGFEDVDEGEPNDSRPSASGALGSVRAAIHGLDLDWFSFDVPSGGSGRWSFLLTDPDGLGCSVDLELGLFDALGAEIAVSDGDGRGCPGLDDARTVLAAGRYFLRVRPGRGERLAVRGRYLLSVAPPAP